MNIILVSVKLNIHQANVADELYKLTNGNFHFIETGNRQQGNSKGGQDFSDRPYLIRVTYSNEAQTKAMQLVREADVMIYGAAPLTYLKERVKTGKLTFLYSERWLKRGLINLLSPRLLAQQWFYHTHCHNKPVYALCASAYAAGDFAKMFTFRDKCYKWGYFTQVNKLEGSLKLRKSGDQVPARIMWCARFIDWKHPELAIQLAEKLKNAGYDFLLDMYGDGPLRKSIEERIERSELTQCVKCHGNVPNDQIHQAMREHDIFLFTSDRCEGWGAVANEAMSEGCCLIGSDEIGAVPYLVKDAVNGLIFKSCNIESLLEKTVWAIEHPEERKRISTEAYKNMREVWSPENAARSLMQLTIDLQEGKECSIVDGPCSKA